jgi:hypothetical protein
VPTINAISGIVKVSSFMADGLQTG